MTLRQEERQREDLLLITWVHVNLVNLFAVLLQRHLQLLQQMLVRVNSGGVALDAVDDLLDLHWVAIGGLDLLRVGEGDVLETVNFTEGPEHGIAVLTSALDLEHLAQIELLERVQGEVVHHLVLGEWLRGVDGEVGGDVVLGVERVHGLEEAELADDVLRGGVVAVADTLELGGGELREHLAWQLHAPVEGAGEGEQLHGG